MRSIVVGLAFSLLALTASSQTKTRHWIQTGSKSVAVSCVDLNSVTKNPDGTTSFESVVVFNECVVEDDLPVAQNIVDCSKVSGKTISVKARLAALDGSVLSTWQTDDIDSETLGGQAAVFVCRKS
jgi:hypothetical protein